jgi:hypothetical protein
MTSGERLEFRVRPHDSQGSWESNDGRYRQYTHELLGDLECLCKEVTERWPVDPREPVRDESAHPELWKLARLRDRTSDSVRIYAAMAAEGYLNFYGVLRLGQAVFDDHFERLGLVPKVRRLLLVCDGVQIGKNDALVLLLDRLAQGRNALVHPKARELDGRPAQYRPTATKLPDVAREAARNMEAFFAEFLKAVPKAANHLQSS